GPGGAGPLARWAEHQDSPGRGPALPHKDRNSIERSFGKLKQFRAVATRYDKRELIYQSTLDLASIWLRDPRPVIRRMPGLCLRPLTPSMSLARPARWTADAGEKPGCMDRPRLGGWPHARRDSHAVGPLSVRHPRLPRAPLGAVSSRGRKVQRPP